MPLIQRALRTLIAVFAVAALTLALPIAVAFAEDCGDTQHPSGRDRCVENGGSDAQGKAQSDPDDDTRGPERSNGGPDKRPDGERTDRGGVNAFDRDDNNGCGNDQDFEDDNEGLCGGPAASTPPGGNNVDEEPKTSRKTPDKKRDDVRFTVEDREPSDDDRVTVVEVAEVPPPPTHRGPDRSTLPATGAGGLAGPAAAGLASIGVGAAALRRARRKA